MNKLLVVMLFSISLLISNAFANTCRDYDLRILNKDGSFVFDLPNCGINDKEIDEVIDYANKHGYAFQYINLSNNQLHAVAAKKLVALRYISRLNLNNNYLGDEGAREISKNIRVSDLRLANNQLTDAGVADLAKQNQLILLDVSNNKLSDQSAIALAKSNLNFLFIQNNMIGDSGSIALAQDIGLMQLAICGNNIGPAGKSALITNKHLAISSDGLDKCSDSLPQGQPHAVSKVPSNKK